MSEGTEKVTESPWRGVTITHWDEAEPGGSRQADYMVVDDVVTPLDRVPLSKSEQKAFDEWWGRVTRTLAVHGINVVGRRGR